MAKLSAKFPKCFEAANALSDAEAKKLGDAAAAYASGDENADYASALADMIAQTKGRRDAIAKAARGAVAGIAGDKTVTVGRGKSAKTVAPAELLKLFNNASAKEKSRILARTGFEVDENPDNGAPILVQVSNPRTLDEVAAAEGVTRAAIEKSLKKFGLTDEVVSALTAEGVADSVSTEELGIDPTANGSGYRIETQASKATNEGLVDDGNVPTKKQKAATEQANELLKDAAASVDEKYDPTTDETREKRLAQAEQEMKRDLARAMTQPKAKEALQDWNDAKSEGGAEFESLPATTQLAWLDAHDKQVKETGNDWNAIEALQRQFERDYETAGPGADSTVGGVLPGAGANPAEVRGGDSTRRANRAGSDDQNGTTGQVLAGGAEGNPGTRPLSDFGPKFAVVIDGVKYDTVQVPDQSRDAFFDAHPGYAAGLKQLEDAGLGFAMENVDALRVSDGLIDGAMAALDFEPSTGVVLYLSRLGGESQHAFNLRHELGHMLDGAFGSAAGGVYSKRQEVAITKTGVPIGEVSRAAFRLSKADDGLGHVFRDNFASYLKPGKDFDPVRAGEELVADLFTIASKDPMKLPQPLRKFALEMLADAKANGETNIGKARFQAARPGAAPGPVRPNRAATGDAKIDAAGKVVGSTISNLKDGTSWAAIRGMFTQDLVNLASSVLPTAKKYYADMMRVQTERVKAERDVSDILEAFRALPNTEQGTGPSSVNGLLRDSTLNKKWAFEPDWLAAGSVEVDPVMAQRFKAISPQAQALVKRVFKHGHESLKALQDAVVQNTTSEFDSEIAAAEEAGDTALRDKLVAEKKKSLDDFQSLLDMRGNWPYAPLKRFGNHVVLGVSKAYLDAKKAGDRPKMQELQKSGDHYYVAFAETAREAKAEAAKIASSFPDGYVEAFEKSPDQDLLFGGRDTLGAFRRLRNVVSQASAEEGSDGVDKATNERLNDLMRGVYLTLLSETSARKSEIHRKGIAGADKDMMRAFATQGRAQAHFLSSLRTDGAVQDSLVAMKEEAGEYRTGRAKRQAYFNELLRRHSLNLEYKPSGFIEKAMAGTSVWMLLTNPAHHLMNALQPGMMSQPLMAARHGYGRAWGELTRAYKDVMPVLKAGPLGDKSYSKLPADVRDAIEKLADRGVIDIALDQDLGQFESASDSKLKVLDQAVSRLRRVAQSVESTNRLSTAIAAYRMERARTGSDEAAIDYAARVIYETHGDYSGFNAPRFMRQGVMRLATQFRKFQLIQLSMFARYTHQAFQGATADERSVGRQALLFSLGHLGVMGGAMAMPGFAAIAWVVGKAFPDDNEPDDPEATLRRLIGDKAIADLLLKGAPKLAGVDLSGRIGAGGMLSVLPYAEPSLDRKGYQDAVMGLLGPFAGGLLPRTLDGVGLMAKGDYWKGLEQMLPSGLGNAAKAARFGAEGVTSRKGEQLLTAEEMGALDLLAQAAGLPSNKLTDRQFLSNAQYKADEFYRSRGQELKAGYVKAVRSNDAEAMVAARQDWADLQAARRNLGYTVQPLSELLKAPAEMAKREKQVVGGVITNKNNKGFTEALADE